MNSSGSDAGGRLLSGVAWNAAGRGLPLLLALVLTPVLLGQLGLERWGLFTLALAMVGVFGVFDLGVGQALTRALAERIGAERIGPERIGAGREEDGAALVGSALAALLAISAVVAIALWFSMPALVRSVLNVPPDLAAEAIAGLRVLAAAAPLVVINAALWGVLAAFQRFRAANLVNIPISVFYYLGPVLLLLVWDSLVGVMLALVLCRLLMTLAYAWLALRDVRGLGLGRIRPALVLPLLRIGGWMTLSGLLTQALLYADRFIIGALLTLAAVAYYATPLDLVLRLWILPVAVVQVLMPALAAGFTTRPLETAALLRQGTLGILLLALPACLLLTGAAWELLTLWLGRDFADGGAGVLRLLGVGIFFSCVAFAPASLLDAIGRPDVTARFALVQGLVFLPLTVVLLWWWGIEGAAAAWVLRCIIDCLGKGVLAARLYPAAADDLRGALPALLAASAGLAMMLLPLGRPLLAMVALLVLAVVAALTWRALSEGERGVIRGRLQGRIA